MGMVWYYQPNEEEAQPKKEEPQFEAQVVEEGEDIVPPTKKKRK